MSGELPPQRAGRDARDPSNPPRQPSPLRSTLPLGALPNLITTVRLVLAPVMVGIAHAGGPAALVLGLMAFGFFTDLIDGALARRLGSTSAGSARLDSLADFAFYLGIPAAGWLMWPAVVSREAAWFAVAVGCVVMPALVAVVKFGHASAYHVWLAKLGALAMGGGVLLLFGLGLVMPFRLAVIIALLAALEEIAITVILERPLTDVRSLWHVLARRRRAARDGQGPTGARP